MKRKGDRRYVGLRVTCRVCDDNRRIGLLGLYTFAEDDGEPWFEGPGVEPSGWNTSLTLRCRQGHNVPMRYDRLEPLLRRMAVEAGVDGRRVVTTAL